jgi:hypothetical protein
LAAAIPRPSLQQDFRIAVAPFAVDAAASEWQLISSAFIFTQNLDRLVRRRFAIAVEFRESLEACGHRQIPFAIMRRQVPYRSARQAKGKVSRPRVSILRRFHVA